MYSIVSRNSELSASPGRSASLCLNGQNFLFKCVGALMRKSTKRELVNKLLDAVFANVKHSDCTEREVSANLLS
jgi:hypothetical protein